MRQINKIIFIFFLFSVGITGNSFAKDGISALPEYTSLFTFQATSEGFGDTSYSGNQKYIIRKAKQDALVFVATAGNIKGVYLEVALIELRKNINETIPDIKLAEFIIIY